MSFADVDEIVYNKDSWNIGMRRVDVIIQQEESQGYNAVATGMYSDTVDIFVFKGNQIVRVYESTNYGKPESYVQLTRAERYRDNLLEYDDVDRVFVCSHEDNLRYLPGGRDFFEQHGIEVRVIGYQD